MGKGFKIPAGVAELGSLGGLAAAAVGAGKLLPGDRTSTDNASRQQCIAAGGKWDDATQTCSMPQPQQPPVTTAPPTTQPTTAPTTPQTASQITPPKMAVSTENFSQEEYNIIKGLMGFSGTQGGQMTPKVQAWIDANPDKLNPSAALLRANQEIAGQPAVSEGLTDVETLMQNSQAADLGILQSVSQRTRDLMDPNSPDYRNIDQFEGGLQSLKTLGGWVASDVKFATGKLIGAAFSAYDNLRAITTGGDTVAVKDARGILNDANGAIKDLRDNAKMGVPVDKGEVDRLFEYAFIANSALERNAKQRSIENYRYWIRDGKDLEIEAEINKKELVGLYEELLDAIRTGRENQIRSKFSQLR